MADNIIYVNNLYKTFGCKNGQAKEKDCAKALIDISLNLKRGELAALVGPDGAGKTTFLRILCGLLKPDFYSNLDNKKNSAVKNLTWKNCGEVLIDGVSPFKDLQSLEHVKKTIGYMPQRFGLYEDLTVIENLNLFVSLNGANGDVESIDTLLEFAGLMDFKDRLAGKLSGGMKQKLGLCCTLISKPKLLLLDEPSVGVDPVSRLELMEIVKKLVKENGISVVWSTSYLDEAEKFERVFLLSEGKKIYDGTPKEATEKMNGLVYLTGKKTTDGYNVNLRTLLRNILNVEENKGKPLADAIVEGDNIRVVFQNKEYADSFFLPKTQIQPRFEDAVIYILKKESGNFSNNISLKALVKSNSTDVSKYSETVEDKECKILIDNTSFVKEDYIGSDYTIEAHNLIKTYGNFTAANDISFSIKKGEIFGLLGPNGAGKSTTFKMLCGLIRPSGGYSSIMGVRMDENPSCARSFLGYMAQRFSLFGDLSVRQNLNFFAGVYGLTGFSAKRRISVLLELFDLKKYEDSNAKDLPLGYKQRLSLSCAIVHNPPVLFLDEPTSGVDPLSRREFWNQINFLSENGTTILITTHFMDEAQYCDRISLIFKGKTLVCDTPDKLKSLVKSDENPNPTMEDAFIKLILKERDGAVSAVHGGLKKGVDFQDPNNFKMNDSFNEGGIT